MLSRRTLIAGIAAALVMPAAAMAQTTPSVNQILRRLEATPRLKIRPEQRTTIQKLKRNPELRRMAPAIDIQSINFAFGSAVIPPSQYGKVENIALALRQLSRRGGRSATVLVEGHTDAVGSFASNQDLSERRAASLKQLLVYQFGISPRMLETVGYGEEYLLVQTQYEEWRNRRVTLRRVDDFLR